MILLALIGPRGSGKTTMAKNLSKLTGQKAICLDGVIEKRAGGKIADLVQEKGWEFFRRQETEALVSFAGRKEGILDCGGGIIEKKNNREILKADNDVVVYLTGAPENLVKRIYGDDSRPPLTDNVDPVKEMEEILKERDFLYRDVADMVINTDNVKPEKIAGMIFENIF